MKLRRQLGLSVRTLRRQRVRTALAVSGTAVGVAGVLVMIAVGEGAERELLEQIDAMGRNLLIVQPTRAEPIPGRPGRTGPVPTLTVEDAVALERRCPAIELAVPSVDRALPVKAGALVTTTTVRAVTPEYVDARNFALARGRTFTREEAAAGLRLAVLGSRVATTLFEERDPLGQRLRVRGIPFEVIGVLESKGASASAGSDEDAQILIPIRTGLRRVFNVDHVTLLYLRVGEGRDLDAAAETAASLLRARHGLDRTGAPDDFTIRNQTRLLAAERDTSASFRRLVTGLALAALLVGGFGILSILTLSVRERRGEIGLRVAIGAKRRDVRNQFLAEALLLGGAGGIAGVAIGLAAAAAVGGLTGWHTPVSAGGVALALGAALAVTLVFGVQPARRAAALDPIESLRAE